MPDSNRFYDMLVDDDWRRDDAINRMKGEPEICKRIIAALERYNDATPERLKALWELTDMSRPTTRQIARAAHLLVLAGEIEVIKIREEGRTVTYYERVKRKPKD